MPKIIKPVSKDSFSSATISVDGQGRIFSAAAGSAGAQGYQLTQIRNGSQAFNYSAVDASATKAAGIIGGGGGGGGNSGQNATGRPGGHGFFGVWAVDVAPGTLDGTAIQVGAGGAGKSNPQQGQAGGTTNFGNLVNAGGGTGGPSPHTPDSPRPSSGSTNTPTVFNYSTTDFANTTNVAPPSPGEGGTGPGASNGPQVNTRIFSRGGRGGGGASGNGDGGDGFIWIFEQTL